jgi:hypothetical protein
MLRAVLLVVLLMATPLAANAKSGSNRVTGWSLDAGIGFFAGPGQFLVQLDAPYRMSKLISVGPAFQLGAGSNQTTVNMTLDGKFHIPVFENSKNAFFGNLTPYIGLGAGYSFYGRSNQANESNLLIPVIIGAEYEVAPNIALTSDMRFSIAATSDFNKFFYTWQMIGCRYRF